MNSEKKPKACLTDEELSAYRDGDLAEERLGEIADHLEECALCRSAEKELTEMSNGLLTLAEPSPPSDLWERIAAQHREEVRADKRLADRSRSAIQVFLDWLGEWRFPVAAAVTVAAGLVLFLIWMPAAETPSSAPTKNQDLRQMQALAGVAAAEQTYAAALAALEESLVNGEKRFSPKVSREIEQTLATIDEAISRCRDIALREPNNLDAHRAVMAAYQQKVDFLTTVVVDPL